MFGFGRKRKTVAFEQVEIQKLGIDDTIRESNHVAKVVSIDAAIAFAGHVKVKLSDGYEFLAQPYETVYRQAA